jgi:hypothetical protein
MRAKGFLTLAISASILAGCGAAATSLPGSAPASSTTAMRFRPMVFTPGHPHVFYSRSYLQRHPEVLQRLHHRSPNAQGNLLYGGGAVQLAPVIYLVFWGFSGPADVTHDPDGLAAYMTDFYGAIPASEWLNIDTQYYETAGGTKYIGNSSGQFAGAYYDPAPPSSVKYTDAQVAAEAVKASKSLGYSADANYVVITPTGYKESGFGNNWCGYHSGTNTASGNLSYTDLPYTPDAGAGCGSGSVTSPGLLDGASIVGGHEESETATDPTGSGWIDASGNEIGDKCAWIDLADTHMPNGSSFPTQSLWSNASRSCVQSYGTVVPGSPTPSPSPGATPSPTPSPGTTPTPPPGQNAVRNAGFESGRIQPWNTCGNTSAWATLSTHTPHDGRFDGYAGVLKGYPQENGLTSVCQLVIVPTNATVTVWTLGVTDDASSKVFQFGAFYKLNGSLDKVLFIVDRNDRTWQQRTFSVPTLAGHKDYLIFGVVEKRADAGKTIGQYVDDVSLSGPGSRSAAPAPRQDAPEFFDLPR